MDNSKPAKGRQAAAPQLDRPALAAIYDEFHPAIYAYIYRQVEDADTARDLAADVFRRLLQAVRHGDGPSTDIKAWLYRTAHNLVVDHYRSRQFRRHEPLNVDFTGIGDDPASIAERHVAAAEVLKAWRQLTDDQQQVIALKFMQELSNEETAAVMGKPVSAVKMLQHRALAALRRLLAETEEPVRP
jgi:RNA polymerase sigma-70 factor (ECF subfamily)